MFAVAVSGQTVGFAAVSAFSGTPLTGLSGFLSGYKSVDGGAQAGLSGFIVEKAFGQYVANLFDFDVSGRIISYYFTGASGMIPVEKTAVTTLNASGRLYPASGVFATVPAASLSGVVANSGLFASVLPANLSGLVVNSGLFVTVPLATISGNNVVANSIRTGTARSGTLSTIQLDAGASPLRNFYQDQLVVLTAGTGAGQSRSIQSYASGTGIATIFPNWASGPDNTSQFVLLPGGQVDVGNWTNQTIPLTSVAGVPQVDLTYILGITTAAVGGYVAVASGQLSGQQVTLTSGQSYPASGVNAVVPPASLSGVVVNSGLFVTVPPATLSGVIANSGLTVIVLPATLSGVIANSGLFVSVPAASLSGVVVNSGLFVTVPIASISGAVANSGLFVSVPIASVSGLNAVVPPATLSGVVANSGLFVNATATVQSGQVYLASGSFLFGSGQFFLASGSVTSGVISSGIYVTATAAPPASGTTYLASGWALFGSGQFYPASGSVYPASGSITSGVISSGIFVTATATIGSGALSGQQVTLVSGQSWLASGNFTVANSGQFVVVPTASLSGVVAASGLSVIVPIASVSGVNAVVPPATLSGVVANSGLTVTVLPTTLSGVVANSGLFVSVPIATQSGLTAIVLPASLSGLVANSGLFVTVPPASLSGIVANSGLFVTVPPASLSGVVANSGLFVGVPIASVSGVNAVVPAATLSGVVPASGASVVSLPLSGQTYLASGQQVVAAVVSDKSGYTLSRSGLDTIQVESGMNARQALSVAAAAAAGRLSGAGTSTIVIEGANASGTVRISGTVDASGNRVAVVLNLPA